MSRFEFSDTVTMWSALPQIHFTSRKYLAFCRASYTAAAAGPDRGAYRYSARP